VKMKLFTLFVSCFNMKQYTHSDQF